MRLVQLHAPWSRGYRSAIDDHLGLSLEAGQRTSFGDGARFVFTSAIGVTYLPAGGSSIDVSYTLTVGLGYALVSR